MLPLPARSRQADHKANGQIAPQPLPTPPDYLTAVTMGGVLTYHYNRDRNADGSLLSHDVLATRANSDLQYLLGTCLTYSSRITRAYIYSWAGLMNIKPDPDNGGALTDFGFDSGLTDQSSPVAGGSATSRHQTRSMYCTLEKAIVPTATCTPQQP